MRTGVVFPQTEIGPDPAVVRDYAQAVEGLGYTHLLVYDHVLGAGTANRPGWTGPYTDKTLFHEPFVLFGYLAAVTQRIELVTGVLVLPQRQTALVAKQAAEVAVLTGNRFRLGVGVGWNDVEFEALGTDFGNRGKRMDEQIALLRELLSKPLVTFEGQWERVTEAGINPLPTQPVPIWIGGSVEATLRRVARTGDGWFPQLSPNEAARESLTKLRQYTLEAGRNPDDIGIEPRITLRENEPDAWRTAHEAWRALGATHVTLNTMGGNLASPQAHIQLLERAAAELGVGG